MFELLRFLGLLYSVIGGFYAGLRHIQMLQQNSYFPSRYFGWLKGSISTATYIKIATCFICAVLLAFKQYLWFMIVALFIALFRIFHAFSFQNKSIKPLVFTARVKRLLTTMGILLFILSILGGYFGIIGYVCLIAAFCLPLTLIAAYYINYYPEKMISNSYINDAKRILSSSTDLKIVGVTGSYGKTSTKMILSRILNEKFNTLATPGSFNTPMGVVRTVRENLRGDTQVFVCEMGAKNIGDITEICEIANPGIGIITSVGPQHLETFGSVENVFKTKFELAQSVADSGGVCFVNGDSKPISQHFSAADKSGFILYGTSNDCDCRAYNIRYSRFGSEFDLILPNGSETHIVSPLLGKHNVVNIAGAAAVASYLSVSADQIRAAVRNLQGAEHRLELKNWLNGSLMIDDAYNANPEGCIEAIRVLSGFSDMKKIIITPGLVELGDKEYDFNYKLGLAAAKVCDEIILVGKKRAIPMVDAIKTTEFDQTKLTIVDRFTDAVALLASRLDESTVVLVENDLPDNYAG